MFVYIKNVSTDTDSFEFPEVEGFAFAGMNADNPTLEWDAEAVHRRYQIAIVERPQGVARQVPGWPARWLS